MATSTGKYDVKVALKALYAPKNRNFELIDIPPQRFIAIDGVGSPDSSSYQEAVQAIYSAAYTLKFTSKATGLGDYVVPPLEALWWADDPAAFASGDKDSWKWTLLSCVPDFVHDQQVFESIEKAVAKGITRARDIYVNSIHEGKCFQVLHIGPYSEEAPLLKSLHEIAMPNAGVSFNGHHHEIYLSDPRRVAPEKLRTILRQPVV